MNRSTQTTYVLENRYGQVIRSLRLESDQVHVIRRHDTKRVEIHSSLDELDQSGLIYTLLQTCQTKDLKKKAAEISKIGTLRVATEKEVFTPTAESKEEKDQSLFFLKWAAIGHVAALMLIFATTATVEYFTHEEPVVVKVVQQQQKIKTPPPTVVAPSKTPVKKTKQVARTQPKKKPVQKRQQQVATTKSKAPQRAKAAPQQARSEQQRSTDVRRMGALGVLGGNNKKANGSGSGLKLGQAAGSGREARGARGGHIKALAGKGVVGGNMGGTQQAQGGGGYGTKGKAGGGAGYGKHSLVGSSAGYFRPLESEAIIEGGLDEDQINSVIMRNRGQIAACYERGLQTSPNLRGRVAINFVIGASGRVSAASVQNSSLRSNQVESCIVQRLRGWEFPKPVGGVNVKVLYPFMLNRVS